MNPIDIITSFVEGKISSTDFVCELFHNKNLEIILSEETKIAPYIDSSGSLFLYLLTLNVESVAGELNAIDALSLFLEKNGISFSASKDAEKKFNLILKIQPRWLDIPDSYLKTLLSAHEDKKDKELEQALKQEIKNRFCYLKKPPKWLQSAHWPIEKNEPLIFVDQIDASQLFHDVTQLYVFYNKQTNTFITIKQSA